MYNFRYEWWAPGGTKILYNYVGTGIRIANGFLKGEKEYGLNADDLYKFNEEVKTCLEYIYLTQVGKKLLDGLSGCNKKVTIIPAQMGMGYVNIGNEYYPCKKVVYTLEMGIVADLIELFFSGGYDVYEFLRCFGEIPVYDDAKVPSMNWEVFRNKIKREGKERVERSYAENFEKARDWVSKKLKLKWLNMDDRAHIRNCVVLSLYDVSPKNIGGDVDITYQVSDKDDYVGDRPSAIGLAHEMVHAYYSVHGLQPSRENAVLDDLLCIGLGPWKGIEICENRIREEWNRSVYKKVKKVNVNNKKKVGSRKSHCDK